MANLSETHPHIVKDWDYKKNGELSPSRFVMSDKTSVWWMCPNKHSYQVSIYSRVRSAGCKTCGRVKQEVQRTKSLLKNTKSFAEKNPSLLCEWDYEKNQEVSPYSVTWGSKKKIWWRCDGNHSWQSTPYSRSIGRGCLECSKKTVGEKIRKGRLLQSGSLADKFPAFLKEWDYENNQLKPTEIAPFSNKKVAWVCKLNHRWNATVSNRTGNNSGCPECNPQSSKIEIYILCELKSIFRNIEWRKKFNGIECDIYIPEIKLGFEIDGGYWHADKLVQDEKKNEFFKDIDIQLIRVRDDSLPKINTPHIQFKNGEDLQEITNRLFEYLLPFDARFSEYEFNQSAKNEFNEMIARLPAPPDGNTLIDTNPEIAREWDYPKNYPLTPDLFSYGSGNKFF